MLYEILIIVVVMLCFCFATQILTIKVMISLMNAKKPAEMGEIKPINIIKKPLKTRKKSRAERDYEERQKERQRKSQEEFEKLMRNLDVYDGTAIGQEEVK